MSLEIINITCIKTKKKSLPILFAGGRIVNINNNFVASPLEICQIQLVQQPKNSEIVVNSSETKILSHHDAGFITSCRFPGEERYSAPAVNATLKDRFRLDKVRHHPYSRPQVVQKSPMKAESHQESCGGTEVSHQAINVYQINNQKMGFDETDQLASKLPGSNRKIHQEETKSALEQSMLRSCSNNLLALVDNLFEKFGGDKSFVESLTNFQRRMHDANIKRSPYSNAEKRVAKMIWLHSKKEYCKLRNMGLSLPSLTTIRSWIELDRLQNHFVNTSLPTFQESSYKG